MASRTAFARQYLVEECGMTTGAVEQIAPGDLLGTIALKMGNGATTYDATRALWDTYHPWIIWVILGVVGLASLIGMIVSYRRAPEQL